MIVLISLLGSIGGAIAGGFFGKWLATKTHNYYIAIPCCIGFGCCVAGVVAFALWLAKGSL